MRYICSHFEGLFSPFEGLRISFEGLCRKQYVASANAVNSTAITREFLLWRIDALEEWKQNFYFRNHDQAKHIHRSYAWSLNN